MSPKRSVRKELVDAEKARQEAATLVCFLLDESGSMDSVKSKTISGFNEYINGLKTGSDEKAKGGKIYFSLTKFEGSNIKIVHSAVAVEDVLKLDDKSYVPGGGTPLFDAIAKTAAEAAEKVKDLKIQNVLFTIMTDGEENQSREFDSAKVTALIKEKEKEGWTFVYLGANQDAWQTGQTFGMSIGSVATYDSNNIVHAFHTLSTATTAYANTVGTSAFKTSFFGDTRSDDAFKTYANSSTPIDKINQRVTIHGKTKNIKKK